MNLPEALRQRLQDREEKGIRRGLKPAAGRVDFCSNDYLGLARSPELHQAVRAALALSPTPRSGATGSRLLSGNYPELEELENHLATFHGSEAALLFNSGYAANTGFFSALPQRGDTILYDEACHASMKDGFRLSFAKAYSFHHNSPEDLRARFRLASGQVYVAVESLYSMDGDFAPLPEFAAICAEQGALLVVDEAHSNGLYGASGQGLVHQLGLEERVFARIITFGKALGSHGAAVLGSQELMDFLVNFSRPFIYTTALPPLGIQTIREAYRLLPGLSRERQQVQELAQSLHQELNGVLELAPATASSPIQALRLPDINKLKKVSRELQTAGLDVRPIFSPTVPQGREQLRVIVHAYNTGEEVSRLTEMIKVIL